MSSNLNEPRVSDSDKLHASKLENGSTATVILWVVACVVVIALIVLLGLYS